MKSLPAFQAPGARLLGLAGLLAPLLVGARAHADAPEPWERIRPVLGAACFECHGNGKSKGGVDLQRLEKAPAFSSEFELWEKVRASLQSGEMPPEDAKHPLATAERHRMVRWIDSSLTLLARENAGDPGNVTLRRLSNAEYDYVIRDLTGISFHLAKEFPADAGGGEGFSNIGDVLFLNPQHLNAYFSAARKLADHASIVPGSGVRFHALRLGTRGPSQLKSGTESLLYRWYQEKAEPHLPKDGEDLREAEYLLASWKWKHRSLTGAESLAALAREAGLKEAFLENWFKMLESREPKSRFLDLTRLPWRALPGPDPANPKEVPQPVRDAAAAIQSQRRSWLQPKNWPVQRAQQDADGLKAYPLEVAFHKRQEVYLVVGDAGDGNAGDWAIIDLMEIQRHGKFASYPEWLRSQHREDTDALGLGDAELASRNLQRDTLKKRLAQLDALLERLGKHPLQLPVEPGALVVQAPCVLSLPVPESASQFKAKARLDLRNPQADSATLQWMLTADSPPDPAAILPGRLTLWKRQSAAHRQTMADFDAMKRVFPDSLERRLEEVARNFHRGGEGAGVYYFNDGQLKQLLGGADVEFLTQNLEDWRFVKAPLAQPKLMAEWDRSVLSHLQAFAARAWRRPLAPEEETELKTIYQSGLAAELDRESAAREVLVRVLVAPDFLFKLEKNQGQPVHPLTPWELAARLSFLLWSSLPDAELNALAASGEILKPEALRTTTLRMLRDARSDALAREFAAQWMGFHNFTSHTQVDTGRFPEFTPELRADFEAEAVAFFSHIIRNDRPVREILGASYTFLNKRLAAHYGIPEPAQEPAVSEVPPPPGTADGLRQAEVSLYGRGGILGMGALLTKTAYPHRTSPVLRGNWLLQSVLGTRLPPPPNNVPKLDENVASPKSLRERLERHRADKACASCHDKIDPLGFALEGFDPIGRRRSVDEFGASVDTSAKTRDGQTVEGAAGLRTYLLAHDREFLTLFCRKLLGYALGRAILPSDQPLLDAMLKSLQDKNTTFSEAVLTLVESSQFTQRRND